MLKVEIPESNRTNILSPKIAYLHVVLYGGTLRAALTLNVELRVDNFECKV